MKLQAMPGCSVLLVFFCLFVSVLFLNPASRELVPRLVSPCGLCPEELHLCPSVPPPTFAISLAITSVQGWFVLTFFLFLCLFCSVLVYMLSSGGKSHIMLKFYRVCSKCQVVVRMVYCFGVPLLEKDPCSPQWSWFPGGGAERGDLSKPSWQAE